MDTAGIRMLKHTIWIWAVAAVAGCSSGPPLPDIVDYNYHIKPILSDNCYSCHGPDALAREAELRLDTASGLLDSVTSTGMPPVTPGRLRSSELWMRIASRDADYRMPPAEEKRQLDSREVALIEKWIRQGAEWKQHWSFVPLKQPNIPAVRFQAWPQNELDYFVLHRLEQEGLAPAEEADPVTLLRRVTLDLTGLPPTIEDVDRFLAMDDATAYESVVDSLLATTHYGERWAWDWLDAARYADTNGFQGDPERTMWPWRDWVVDALNANMPYDQFTVEQLAGDLLPDATEDQILATAFNRNHMYNGEGGRIPEETRVENVFDRVETTGTIWMGLTLNCARCHDHKFDPITQREYYQLFDYFNHTSEEGFNGDGKIPPVLDVSEEEHRKALHDLDNAVKQMAGRLALEEERVFPYRPGQTPGDSPAASGLLGEHVAALRQAPVQRNTYSLGLLRSHFENLNPRYAGLLGELIQAKERRSTHAARSTLVMVMDQRDEPRTTRVLIRGTYNDPADSVFAGVPSFLPPLKDDAPGNRLALAQWLVDDLHPLTARVTVNRYWQAFFGRGLTSTPEDYGAQGQLPTHPLLLDFLAAELIASGWDIKQLHKRIVLSATYRQRSQVSEEALLADPGNTLLARGPRHRLPAWMIRDQALRISGLLNSSQGGPPVKPYQPEGLWAEATFGHIKYERDQGPALYRRSLYTFWRRIVGPPVFFDNADRQVCTVKSVITNTPLHALTTLNDVTFVEAARMMAERIMHYKGSDEDRMRFGFRLAMARKPDQFELDRLQSRFDVLKATYANDPQAAMELLSTGDAPRDALLEPGAHAAWTNIATLLMNLDESLSKQ